MRSLWRPAPQLPLNFFKLRGSKTVNHRAFELPANNLQAVARLGKREF
ncbi:MAG: hypothetical protein GQF41_3469 [Candidatus Rifleibacterium amylolyticum]|nr:MAG: hypothetical protein GQF41_3469 [Candidatus Rifleibacterium amylolyticum]